MTEPRFGVYVPRDVPLDVAAEALDASPFEYASIGEHVSFFTPTAQSLVALTYLAARTQRVRLLSSVLLAPLYPPGLLAKMVAEIALYSHGRFDLGVGVGGENAAEFAACGVPVSERGSRTDETLEILLHLLREDRVTHRGRHWQFEDVTITPRPGTQPPIWVGGRREPAMRRAGRFGDVWLPYFSTPEQCRESHARVVQHALDGGRAEHSVASGVFVFLRVDSTPGRARQTGLDVLSLLYGVDMSRALDRYGVVGTPAECTARLLEYRAAGVERFVFSTLGTDTADHLGIWERLASDVLPSICGA